MRLNLKSAVVRGRQCRWCQDAAEFKRDENLQAGLNLRRRICRLAWHPFLPLLRDICVLRIGEQAKNAR